MSENRARANRFNAQKSTGPRSSAGKSRSARNAYVHDLSQPIEHDAVSLSRFLRAEPFLELPDHLQEDGMLAFAALQRVAEHRRRALESLAHGSSEHTCSTLQELILLDRYRQRSLARWGRLLRSYRTYIAGPG